MGRILKWLGLTAGVVAAVGLCFVLYSHFLVDYSLENLELALSASDQKAAETTRISSSVYQKVVSDLALEEASDEEVSYKNMALLELASRSFGEALDRAGHERARIYLEQAAESKRPDRSWILRSLDEVYRYLQNLYRQILSLIRYVRRQVAEEEETADISSLLLLTQAEEKEQRWELAEAEELYRNFLEFYPDHPERDFVIISLGHVLLKQKKYTEAERLLRGLTVASTGFEEYQLASNLLRKINRFRKAAREIESLENRLLAADGTPAAEAIRLKLGLLYLHTYTIQKAREFFSSLENAGDENIRKKAKFYLGWIYKLQAQYDQGADVLLNLMEETELDEDMGLGLNAQLADIYYQQKEPQKSLEYYKKVSETVDGQDAASRAASEAWRALAESEQAVIYYFNLKDPEAAGEHLDNVGLVLPGGAQSLDAALKSRADESLRMVAFRELRNGRVHEALDLFKKATEEDPQDAWSYAGLATAYVLLADLYQAREFAQRAHDLGSDSYTASILAYVLGYLGERKQSVHYYRWALKRDPDSIPASFNLACMLILEKEYIEAMEILASIREGMSPGLGLMRSKVLNNMGYALWAMGDREEAKARFQEALKLNPDFRDAAENLEFARRGEPLQTMNFSE